MEWLCVAKKDEYFLILNSYSKILDYAQKDYIGKEVISVIEEKSPGYDTLQVTGIIAAGARGEEGVVTAQFLSGKGKGPLVKTVLAFAPIHAGPKPWVNIVAMEYNLIGWPIMRNAIDNLFFIALVIIAAFILLKLRTKLFKDGIALIKSNIIIKQLRSDAHEAGTAKGTARSYSSKKKRA